MNISDNDNPNDISGGYLAEFKHGQNEKGQNTINGTVTDKQWNVVYPKIENTTEAQLTYLQE